jgi:sugar phosphate isomerase/epimerase
MLTRYDPDGLARTLDLFEDLGADHVELNATGLGVIVGGALRPERLRAVQAALSGRRLGVTVHAPLALNFSDEANAAQHHAVAVASIDLCAALGARRLVVHPGWIEGRRLQVERERLLGLEREALRALAVRAAAARVLLCLENMPTIPEALSGALLNHGLDCCSVRDQVEAVAHPAVAATIDVSHAFIAAAHLGLDPLAQVRALAPVTRHLHLHDSFGRVPSLPRASSGEDLAYGLGDLHLPLGWGTLPWEAVMRGLPLPADTTLTLEIMPGHASREVLADSLARARALAALVDRGDGAGASAAAE